MLLEELRKKEKPFCYLETHAGIGRYDLTSEMAQKTREYENGVLRIYNQPSNHEAIKTYQKIVAATNNFAIQTNVEKNEKDLQIASYSLNSYPGSPAIAHALLRPQDSMILAELHKDDVAILKQNFAHDRNVAIHHMDGYQSLKAFLPPKKGRGLIFIDPPFEQPNEFSQIIESLHMALQRYPIGIYFIWYPIKDSLRTQIENFHHELQTLKCKNIVPSEIAISKNSSLADNDNINGLNSCGAIIVNAPWNFQQQLNPVINWLEQNLT